MSTARPLANITRELLEPIWSRRDIAIKDIAARLGVTRQAICSKAKTFGLPSRAGNQIKYGSDDIFRRLWLAGVSTNEIAAALGYSHKSAVGVRSKAMGLPARTRMSSDGGPGGWPRALTMAQYQEQLLAERMAREAASAQTNRRRGRAQ